MQGKGRTEQERSDPVEDVATADARGRGSDKGHHGGKHGDAQEQVMMEQVLAPANLKAAWRRVKANAGAPGIDGMNVEEFPAFMREQWPRISSALTKGTYRPAPVRRVFIPKPDGAQRPLGVPTVLDRVIQQALAQVLTPLFESGFSDHSYGFRENRNAHQAVREVEACWKEVRKRSPDAIGGTGYRTSSTNCAAMSSAGSTTSGSATPIRRCASWRNGSGEECGCITGSNGNSRGRADATYSRWGFPGRKSTWRRAAAKGIGG